MLRSQLVAVPSTLSTRVAAAWYPGSFSTAWSGGLTANRWAAPMPLNTCGNGPLASSRLNSENIVLACDGMIRSIVVSTSESSTCLTTTGNDDAVRTEAVAHPISSIDSTLTAEPPTQSRVRDDGLVIVCRTYAPIDDAMNWPMIAKVTRMMNATPSC